MSIPDSPRDTGPDGALEPPLERLLAELDNTTDPYRVRQIWADALRHAPSVEDRDRVLVAAASRLPNLVVEDGTRSSTDRLWLREVSRELVLRGGDLSNELSATAQKVMREVVFIAMTEITAWTDARAQGQPALEFLKRSPREAASLRELGRLVHRLRTAGVMGFVEHTVVEDLLAFHEALAALSSRTEGGSVGEWMRVTNQELRKWAETPEAKHQLPILVRRLVRETGDRITHLHFPAGTSVTADGWDGVVEAEGRSLFVPEGTSGWELSTEEPSQRKAQTDFRNRVDSVPVDMRRSMTYVEVICRPWKKAAEFRDTAAASGEFAAVKAYNIDDLETWLEQAPATSIWFKELLGAPVTGVRSIDEAWATWMASTTTQLTEDVVLAGRDKPVEEVRARASSGPGVTTVGGDIRLDEVVSFFGAAAQSSSDTEGGLKNLVVVHNETAARHLYQTTIPMSLLLASPELAATLPPASNHHVFVAVPGGDRVDVSLPRIDSRVVAERFRATGVDFHVASERGELARRSLLALRRLLAVHPEIHRPDWAKGAATIDVRRVLLLQTWNRERDADRSAVEELLSRPYAETEERLFALARSEDDPFVAIFDDRWHVVSATDSWLLVAGQLTPADIADFSEIAIAVLTDVDPMLSLPDEARWRASLDGMSPSYSPYLRRGIARTLALLGALGLPESSTAGRSGAAIAQELVGRVLQRANTDSTFATWTAVAPHLLLLVEAAPRAVIEGLRAGLAAEPPLMPLMFRDQEDSLLVPRSSPHIQFLWALERLAWSPEHLSEAIEVIAELTELDPGGRWSNRPASSLKSILCAWHPNTSAKTQQQIQVVERLRTSHPSVAWETLLSLLPNSHASIVLQRGPEYRDWKQGEPSVTVDEFRKVVSASALALIADAGLDVERWTTLIAKIDNIPEDVQPNLRQGLARLSGALTDDGDRRAVWEALRGFTSRHRQYADAKWALPEAFLAELDPITALFEPADPQHKYGWLFAEGMIQLGDFRRRDDFTAYDAEVDRRRREAIGEIYDRGGLDAVLEFASNAAFPGQVGLALARHSQSDDDDPRLFAALSKKSEVASSLAFAYFGERFRQRGWPYIDSLASGNEPGGTARLLRSTWEPIAASAKADALGDKVAAEFWREFSYFGLVQDFDGVLEVAARLQAVGRHAAALDFLALYSRRTDSVEFATAIADALEGLMKNPDADPDIAALREYDFDLLMNAIAKHRDEVGRERAVRLEWYFLPALGFDPDAPNLHRALAEDPAFFVEMIQLMYRPANRPEPEPPAPTEGERRAAENALRLLHAWRRCPGTDDAGHLDEEALRSWVTEARRLLEEPDRTATGDDEIGQALVAAPADESGWPPLPVKKLIEELGSDHLDRGFERRIFNNRGVTSRSLDAGGRQEWELVAKYRASAEENRVEWPRVARVFDGLAATYEADARREDAAAERRRRGID